MPGGGVNPGLTLDGCRTLVRNLIFEPSGDTGLVSDSQVDDFINAANEMVWKDVVAKKSSVFMTRTASDVTIVAATGIAYANIDAVNSVYTIAQVEQKINTSYFTMEPLSSPQDRNIYEPSFPPIPVNSRIFRWYVEGETLYVAPTPTVDIQARVTYIPGLVDLTTGADRPLQAKLDRFHRLVAYEAACLIFGKDEASPGLILQTRDRMRKQLERHLSTMSAYKSRGIHHVPYM